jgi:hypothetical protein
MTATPLEFADTAEAIRQPWIVEYYRAGWHASWSGLPRSCPWGANTRPARIWLRGWDAAMGIEALPVVRKYGRKAKAYAIAHATA